MSLTKPRPKTNPNSYNARERNEHVPYIALMIAGTIITIVGSVLVYITAAPDQKRYEILSSEAFKIFSPNPDAFLPPIALIVLGGVLLAVGAFHFLDIGGPMIVILALTGLLIIGDTLLGAMPQNDAQQAFNQWLQKDARLSQVHTNATNQTNWIIIPDEATTEPILMKTRDNKLVFVTFHNNENVITYTTKPATS